MRLALLTLWLILSPAFAEETETLESIQRAREKLLESIVTYQEQAFENHLGSADELTSARIRLYRFQRNNTSDFEEKQQHQQKIVQCQERQLKLLEALHKRGDISALDIIQGRERILAARQRLLKIQAKLKANEAKPTTP